MNIFQPRTFIRTHQRPISMILHSFHKQIRNPKGIEQIPRSLILIPMILPQIQKRKDIRMPWFQIRRNTSLPLPPSLIDIPRCIIKHPQHGHNPITRPIRSSDVGLRGTDIGNRHPNPSCIFTNHCTVFQRIVDPINGIFLHTE